ncbi:hypothetical protein EZS27_011658 [termite gut metagenome]|uniref:OsmC family protein n=1 Tax=termite gut metagenome TaxID=433724 RepID=A0A5J4S578_9ZZZZ
MKFLLEPCEQQARPLFQSRLLVLGIFSTIIAGITYAQTAHSYDPGTAIFTTAPAQVATQGNVPTLRDFLVRRRAALSLLQNLPSDQLQPVTLQARTTAEQRAGVRRIRIRGFQIVSDSGPDYAGYNLGPSSPESALAVIASDIADTFLSQAALKGIQLDSLEVEVASRPNLKPEAKRVPYPNNLIYTAYIASPASDAELADLRKAVEENSPIFNLITHPQKITGDIDYTKTPAKVFIPEGFQPGLREYLKYKRIAYLHLQEQAKKRVNTPVVASDRIGSRVHVKVEGGTGVRRLHIRQFEILHDNPAYLAGNDLGPSAQEHQLGVLTSCLTHIFLIQAAAQQVTLDTLEVSVKGITDIRAGRPGFENVPRSPHNIFYTVHIKSPASFEQIQKLRDDVEAVCPIYNLLKDEVELEGRIIRKGGIKGA